MLYWNQKQVVCDNKAHTVLSVLKVKSTLFAYLANDRRLSTALVKVRLRMPALVPGSIVAAEGVREDICPGSALLSPRQAGQRLEEALR